MKILRSLHTGYGMVVFSISFLVLFPLMIVPVMFPSRFSFIGMVNRFWARVVFTACLLPYKVEVRGHHDKKSQYIFCPNHFSYLDIPVMGLNPHNTIFVGKNEMEKIPLFGYMYRNLHITVDRSKLKSRKETMIKILEALDLGKSLVIYPEGGILSTQPPMMTNFKDGAFRAAIEKQIPIVPVTIPYNWIILPDNQFLVRWGAVHVIFHEPISTVGMTLDDIDSLKERVRDVIQTELLLRNKQA